MPIGQSFMINDIGVASPDQEIWLPEVIGESIAGTQRRSPYQTLEWRRQASDRCKLDWFDYNNTVLTSLTCTPPGEVDQWIRYTDAICRSVTMRKSHGVANEVVATFLVNTG